MPSSLSGQSRLLIVCGLSVALIVAIRVLLSDPADAKADAVVARLGALPVPMASCEVISVGFSSPCPTATLRRQLYNELRAQDGAAIRALSRAYDSPIVLVRRNAAAALETLGGGYDVYPGYGELRGEDISAAVPGLLKGLSDSDKYVRGISAQSFSHVGAKGAPAVRKLIEMLNSGDEGDRITACIGLRGIGSTARAALPALRRARDDPSYKLNRMASLAIESIEHGDAT